MPVYDVNGNVIVSDLEIKPQYSAEMETTIESVRSLMTEPCIVFPLITDIHYLSESKLSDQTDISPSVFLDSIDNIAYFASKMRCDMFVNLGDNTDGAAQATTISRNKFMLEKFRSVGLPFFPCIGNHDTNQYGTGKFTTSELYREYISGSKKICFDSGMVGTNYYVDFDDFKIRFIWINCENANGTEGFTSQTVSWFTGTALDTPDNYNIVVFGHLSPIASLNFKSQNLANSATISNAIASYESTTKHVIAYIYGHNHGDGSWVENSFRSITVNCTRFMQGTRTASYYPTGIVFPDRALGTATEDCWTVVVIRPEARKLNLVRFGGGNDYEFSW